MNKVYRKSTKKRLEKVEREGLWVEIQMLAGATALALLMTILFYGTLLFIYSLT